MAKLVFSLELGLAAGGRKHKIIVAQTREIYFSCNRILEAAVHADPALLTMEVYQSFVFLLQYLSGFHHEGCPWSKIDFGAPA